MNQQPEQGGAASVADVIDRMVSLSATMPVGDGVRAFNEMYLVTTRQVAREILGTSFADPAFMARLDVVFAGLYFNALERFSQSPSDAPRCWRALFELRSARGVSQLQFATAGMNAHINHDLPRALVRTAAEFGVGLDDNGPRHADFVAINHVLARTAPMVKRELLDGPFAALDHALGEQDDRVGMWAIGRAREFAWATAQAQWAVRGSFLEQSMAGALDSMVALSSRLLLAARA